MRKIQSVLILLVASAATVTTFASPAISAAAERSSHRSLHRLGDDDSDPSGIKRLTVAFNAVRFPPITENVSSNRTSPASRTSASGRSSASGRDSASGRSSISPLNFGPTLSPGPGYSSVMLGELPISIPPLHGSFPLPQPPQKCLAPKRPAAGGGGFNATIGHPLPRGIDAPAVALRPSQMQAQLRREAEQEQRRRDALSFLRQPSTRMPRDKRAWQAEPIPESEPLTEQEREDEQLRARNARRIVEATFNWRVPPRGRAESRADEEFTQQAAAAAAAVEADQPAGDVEVSNEVRRKEQQIEQRWAER